jgi:hypothetical protein
MAGRGRTSFQKRQKEQLRLERRQQKAARKQERKANPGSESDDIGTVDDVDLAPDARIELNPAGGIIIGGSDSDQDSSEQPR